MAPFDNVLVTGGAGFVGSNLAIALKCGYEDVRVTVLDNLKRRGSELNLTRLQQQGVRFVHGDIRNPEDLALTGLDLVMECSAEPSVLAAYDGAAEYVVRTNLLGTVNCLELARRTGAAMLFISTSRVYPLKALNAIETVEEPARFAIASGQTLPGISPRGISEEFPLTGARTLYGATKLASELLVAEYAELYGLRYVIDRCGVIAGPWQMGKVDQGVFALWVGRHYFGQELTYTGWGGSGKQVRDVLHIDDLVELVEAQLARVDAMNARTFNVGGGPDGSLSLVETTTLCKEITGRTIPIAADPVTRPGDIKVYVTDNARVEAATGWRPRRPPRQVLEDIHIWLRANESLVRPLWQ
jgi:CDP-paratose 2-epimerase